MQGKVEELEDLNQSLRNREKMKDDAIAQLSDQIMALTARMHEIERKQQPCVSYFVWNETGRVICSVYI